MHLRTFGNTLSAASNTQLVVTTVLLLVAFSCAFSATPASAAAQHSTANAVPTQPSTTSPDLPPPGTYSIDPVHTFVYFSAWHHIVGVVRGRFEKTTGTITVAKDPGACSLDVTIEAFSLSTQYTERDDDLRGPDFFDVVKFPTMTYHGQGVRRSRDGLWIMDGTLSVRGVGKAVPIQFTFKGLFPDTKPGKPIRAAFHATAATKRADFNMTRDNPMELGVPPTPGYDVDIQIDVEADAESPKK